MGEPYTLNQVTLTPPSTPGACATVQTTEVCILFLTQHFLPVSLRMFWSL